MVRDICVVTGSRADYGLLYWLMKEIRDDPKLDLKVIATGMHLSPEFGLTYKVIEQDGFHIDNKVEMLLSSDTPIGISKSLGLGVIGISEALEQLQPDVVILLGDRFEMFAAASAAVLARSILVHIHGGELTQGAVDEVFRHSITKMSHLHFVSTDQYRNRVIQLGESPNRVFNVGAVGIENIHRLKLLSKKEFEKNIDFLLGDKSIIVTYHPVTLEDNTAEEQFVNLIEALDSFDDLRIVFTKSNADTNGRIINTMIDDYASRNADRCKAFTSMGQLRYLSAMQYVQAVVGNSSSGIIEAPSFRKPTVNIGDRQKGRLKPVSIIDCAPDRMSIVTAIEKALSNEFNKKIINQNNPYEKKKSASKMISILKQFDFDGLLKKEFYDIL